MTEQTPRPPRRNRPAPVRVPPTLPTKHLPPGGLWNESDVARVLSVSSRTVRRWRACGDGPPFVSYGRVIRYVPAAVIRYIEAARSEHR